MLYPSQVLNSSLNTLFPTCNLHSSLKVKDHILHPYNATGKTVCTHACEVARQSYMVVGSNSDDILNIFKIFKTQFCTIKLSTIS